MNVMISTTYKLYVGCIYVKITGTYLKCDFEQNKYIHSFPLIRPITKQL